MTFVTLVTNGNRNTVPAAGTKTPREILTENGVDFSAAQATLDGTILTPDKLNMSLTALASVMHAISRSSRSMIMPVKRLTE